jgi:hypothetical protein
MRFTVAVILTALLALAMGLFLPWYTIAAAAFLVALVVPQKPLAAWAAAFLSIFLLWGIHSLMLSSGNDHRLSTLAGEVILKSSQPFLLIFVTALLGGVVASFAGVSGSLLRSLLKK